MNLEDYKEFKEEMENQNKQVQQPVSICPTCGKCPTCGRQARPYIPAWYGYQPYGQYGANTNIAINGVI